MFEQNFSVSVLLIAFASGMGLMLGLVLFCLPQQPQILEVDLASIISIQASELARRGADQKQLQIAKEQIQTALRQFDGRVILIEKGKVLNQADIADATQLVLDRLEVSHGPGKNKKI